MVETVPAPADMPDMVSPPQADLWGIVHMYLLLALGLASLITAVHTHRKTKKRE